MNTVRCVYGNFFDICLTATNARKLKPIDAHVTAGKPIPYSTGARKAPVARPRDNPAMLKAIKVARALGITSVINGISLTSMNSNEI